MDLPTCPSCGASVLDEDAADCPFCGAAMSTSSASGKPSGTKQPSQEPSNKKAPANKRTKRETVVDDDPFDLERQQQTTKVIPLLRKPVKGKMFRVVCPMCDTPGFASSKVVGKEVKCRNSECLAPVFQVPNPDTKDQKSTEQEKPKEKKKSKLPLVAVVLVAVVLLGGGYYYLTRVPDGSELSKPFDHSALKDASRKSFSTPTNNKTNSPDTDSSLKIGSSKTSPKPQKSTQAVQKEALEMIIELSRARKNRSKPYSRRLAAEAYALSGDIKSSQEQIDYIDRVSPPLPFYKIFPLIEIGWLQLKEKDSSGLKTTLDQTEQLSKRIPEYGGRDTLDLVARLAAFWIAAGKEDLAETLIKKYQKKDSLAQLSAYLQVAHETNRYNFESLIDLYQEWNSPQWVAVTLILITKGYPQEALNWAALAPEPIARTEAVTEWALSQVTRAVSQKQKPETSLIQPAETKLSSTGSAFMYAICAQKLISLNLPKPAEIYLEKSKSFLTSTPVPAPIELGNIKAVNDLVLPLAAPLKMLAETNLQIASVESKLGQKVEATKFLNNAVQSIRAIAPSVEAVQSKINETSNFNFKDQIKEALNLSSNDRVRRGINEYRKQLRNLKSAAENRLALLVQLLSQASRSQLASDAWKIALESHEATNLNLKDALLQSSLPAVMIQSVDQSNNELVAQIKKTLNDSVPGLSKEDLLIQQVSSLVKNGRPEQAAHEINQSDLKKAWKAQLSLQLLSILMNESQFEQAIQFITALKDPILREDMLNTLSAVAVIEGHISVIEKLLGSNLYSPTEKISGYLGLICGIRALPNEQTSTSTPKVQPKNL
ncbi:hypothetical protein [Gimesia aquarii]|uniref:Uncharacterized protein n=1 Tax=Gimesia aquarii TaxID=2527964 RepID=A0A517VY33_9PLAN|nr:hypothetical protein [Gimesia aquarii]QDT97905.1 hypothetical protein V144x_33880 [Gimesia aquarii]